MEKLNITGLWWLSTSPADKVSGTLTYSNETGPILSLLGALGGMQATQGQAEIGTIYGVGEKYTVTLEKCFTRRLEISTPGLMTHELGSSRVYTGAHLEESDLKFNRIDIGVTYLPEFINRSSLVGVLKKDKSNTSWKGLEAKVSTQKPLKIGPVPDGYVSASFGWSQSQEKFRSLTLRENCVLRIELNKSIDAEEFLNTYVRHIQNLVTLATDCPNMITSLTVYNPLILREHTSKALGIDIFERIFLQPIEKDTKDLSRDNMLFTLKDLKRNRINNWISISQKFLPVVGILFGQRYSNVGVENKLLNAVSAVEAYHRRKFQNVILSKAQWKIKRARILSSVKKPDKEFANSVLQYANIKSLSSRLEEVVKHSGIKDDFIPDFSKWSKAIRGFRNTLTHYDPESPQEIKNYIHVHWLSDSISWIMMANLMIETGFTRKEVLKLLQQNRRYIFTRERVKEVLSEL